LLFKGASHSVPAQWPAAARQRDAWTTAIS
jgi:hypothetical protein